MRRIIKMRNTLNSELVDYIIKKKSEDFKYFLDKNDLYTKEVWNVFEECILEEGEISKIERMNEFMKQDFREVFQLIINIILEV